MGVFGLRRGPQTAGLAGHTDVRGDRDRRRLRRDLARGMQRLQALQDDGVAVLELQPLVQICSPASYPAWKARTQKAWAKTTSGYTTQSWPAEISEGRFGVLLLPIAAGRVGPAAGRVPRAIASPLFTLTSPGLGYMDAVLVIVTRWVCNPGEKVTALLAAPVIEIIQGGATVERRVEELAVTWPLPHPDGL